MHRHRWRLDQCVGPCSLFAGELAKTDELPRRELVCLKDAGKYLHLLGAQKNGFLLSQNGPDSDGMDDSKEAVVPHTPPVLMGRRERKKQ